jgi:hypothetical protein
MNATWRSLGTLCRERGWSKPRLLHELQNGLPYRTIPLGHAIDWRHAIAAHSLDVDAGTVMILGDLHAAVGFDARVVGVEVLPPTAAEVLPPTTAAALPSVQWAASATRRLREEGKIPQGVTKAALGRLLEAEAEKAVKTGRLKRALKASYLEDQLVAWGIWPLNSLE